jgi:hypothetical protein
MVEWLGEAYEAVCKRKDPLTQQEGVRLGVEDVIRISAVRQIYGLTTPRYDPMLLSGDLPKIFAFDTVRGQQHSVKNCRDQEISKSVE